MTLEYPKPFVCRVGAGTWRCSAERPWGAMHHLVATFTDALAIANQEAQYNPIYSKESLS